MEVEFEEFDTVEEIFLYMACVATMKRNDGGKTVAMGIDNKKNTVYLTDSSNMLDSISAGDVIECMPAQIGRASCRERV